MRSLLSPYFRLLAVRHHLVRQSRGFPYVDHICGEGVDGKAVPRRALIPELPPLSPSAISKLAPQEEPHHRQIAFVKESNLRVLVKQRVEQGRPGARHAQHEERACSPARRRGNTIYWGTRSRLVTHAQYSTEKKNASEDLLRQREQSLGGAASPQPGTQFSGKAD